MREYQDFLSLNEYIYTLLRIYTLKNTCVIYSLGVTNRHNRKPYVRRLPMDLRSGILCAGLRNTDEKTWNMTLERYLGSTNEDEKAAILNGLGCVTSENITKKFLALTIEDNPVVNIFDALASIYTGNSASFDVLIEFIQKNMEKIQKE